MHFGTQILSGYDVHGVKHFERVCGGGGVAFVWGSFTQAHRELSWEVFTSGQRQFNVTPKYKDKQNEETRLLLPGGFSVCPSRDLE